MRNFRNFLNGININLITAFVQFMGRELLIFRAVDWSKDNWQKIANKIGVFHKPLPVKPIESAAHPHTNATAPYKFT